MKITSNAFQNNQLIPDKYTCKGQNVNPELKFIDIPIGAKSLALIVHDPDAPDPKAPRPDGYTHWVVFNMPAEVGEIPEAAAPSGVLGKNGSGETRYTGPCPPIGTHRYFFKLYALDDFLPSAKIQSKEDLDAAMQGHILEEAELVGLYAHQ